MRIEDKVKVPIIQGGMGVGISLSKLAGSVASLGGIGTISAADIGFKEKDFFKNRKTANYRAIFQEVKKAKEISKGKGLIAMNIMYASFDYDEIVKKSIEAGVDLIISGAGLPLNLAELTKGKNVLIGPIVSSLRALRIILKRWKKVDKVPDLIIVEGPLAGGHLGFKDVNKAKSLREITKEILNFLKEENLQIKVFPAGGIRNKEEVQEFLSMGAYGVQVATPFIASYQCDAHENFKKEIIRARDEDLSIINSPVGMPARAIKNKFLYDIEKENIKKRNISCIRCIKTCDSINMKYCISEYLIKSVLGFEGLVFSGARIDQINKIRNVKEIIGDYFNI